MSTIRVTLFTLLMTLALPAIAQRTGVPESWVGTWAGVSTNLPPGLKIEYSRNFDPATPKLMYGQLSKTIIDHLQPWAIAKMEATEWDLDDTGQVCKLSGIFRQGSAGGGGFTLLQAPGKIILLTNIDEVGARRVYFNSPHPPNLPPTWNGDSRAHWDGDTLVIDTIGFNDKSWLSSDREPHTEELHVVERLRPVGDQFIELRVFVADRKALKSPYTYTRVIKKMPKETEMRGGVCNEAEGESLWQTRRNELLDERENALQDFIKQVISK